MKNEMSILFLAAVLLLRCGTADPRPPDFLWAAQAGGADWDFGRGIATDASGNSIATGYFSDSAVFGDTTLVGTGDYALFVAKYDEAGDLVWAAAAGAGGTDDVSGEGIATDDWGHVVVAGHFEGTANFGDTTLTSAGGEDIFIAKYDENGNFLWAAQAGGTDMDHGISIATDDSGNVIVTGGFWSTAVTFGDTTLISAGGCDIFIAKYDSAGSFLWAAQAGGTDSDHGWDIDTDPWGDVVVTGRFAGSATFGDTTLVAVGARDMFVARYDSAGTFLWAAQAGGTGLTWGYGIATDGSGNGIVTGEFSGTVTFGGNDLVSAGGEDIFIAKYDTAGDLVWVVRAGGTGSDVGLDIATDDSGNGILTGYFSSATATFGDTTLTCVGGWDIFVAKCDAAGDFVWAVQAGGTGGEVGLEIATDGSGNSVVTGHFTGGPATFGDTTLTSIGEYDIFIAKLGTGATGIEGEFIQPRSLELLQNHPNPFNHATSLRFWVADLGMVSLKVYDISGREIRTLVSEQKQPGTHAVLWDGRSDAGVRAPSGVYFSKLQAGSFVQTRKMLLLR